MKRLEPRVLYFTPGSEITAEDTRKANLISYNLGFRNASQVGAKDTIEDTDAVAGEAPKVYRAAYPYVETAIQLAEVMRRKKAGTLRLPKFANASEDEGDGSITEAELAQLSGENAEVGDGDTPFDHNAFLADKSSEFVAGYELARNNGALPESADDETSAGFNAFAANNVANGVPDPQTNTPAPAPTAATNRHGRKAKTVASPPASATPPPAPSGPTWNT